MPQLEIKNFTIEVKEIDADQGIIRGYLSTFNNIDYQKDRVLPGAFKKTIAEALQRKTNKSKKYLWPLLWMHDPEKPIGGFLDAIEDAKGLFVTAQADITTNVHGVPNNPLAVMVFSGYKVGYVDEFSMGYKALQKDYDADGVRNLKEVQIWEGSAVTSLFAANNEALATDVKSACGSEDWPLAGRSEAWDGNAAHRSIIAWASKEDGSIDEGKMKSVHFWYDAENADKITAYKLPFCVIRDGKPVAIPRGIFAVAGVLSGARGGAELGGDAGAVKARVAHYYDRMAKQFSDPSIKPPWEGGKTEVNGMEEKTGRSISKATAETIAAHVKALNDLAIQHKAMAAMHYKALNQVSSDLQALLGTPENFDGDHDADDPGPAKTGSEPGTPLTTKAQPGNATVDAEIAQFQAWLREKIKHSR